MKVLRCVLLALLGTYAAVGAGALVMAVNYKFGVLYGAHSGPGWLSAAGPWLLILWTASVGLSVGGLWRFARRRAPALPLLVLGLLLQAAVVLAMPDASSLNHDASLGARLAWGLLAGAVLVIGAVAAAEQGRTIGRAPRSARIAFQLH